MTGPKVLVYAGPTISAEEVRAILPEAQVRPPVARGDLLAGDWRRGDVAVVVDGYFREQRSVGHKEILYLLSEGVEVIGTASMGALRAAELGPCGMRGLGEVHRMYTSGEIDGDDEVGVLHGPATMGYPAQTVALVNLRYGVHAGTRAGQIPADSGRRIVAAAKAMPFAFRTWQDIGQDLGEGDRAALRTLEWMIDSGEWDVKRLDALSALRAVHSGAKPGPAAPDVTWTGLLRDQVRARRWRREYAPGRWMSDLDVLDAARLFDDGYPRIHEDALTGLLTALAAARGLTVGAYARAKLGVADGSDLPDPLASWLTEAERTGLPAAERLRLVIVRVWPVWQSPDWRPAVLARLRESGRWPEWTGIVVRAEEIAEETRHRLAVPPPALCGTLFLRHWRPRGSSPEVELARRGFTSRADLGETARRFFAYDVQCGRRIAD